MINIFYQNVSVNAVMAQTFPPGMTNWNTGMRTKFSICRRDNHALGMTLDRYSVCLALAGTFLMKICICKKENIFDGFIHENSG